jgi:hypothetical protein
MHAGLRARHSSTVLNSCVVREFDRDTNARDWQPFS